MKKARPRDEIIEEVRRVREELGARYDHDLDRLYEVAKQREGARGWRVLEARSTQIRLGD